EEGSIMLEEATTNWHHYDVATLFVKQGGYRLKEVHADAIANVMMFADYMKDGDFELFSLLSETNDIQKLQSLAPESYLQSLLLAWCLRGQKGQDAADKKQTLEILKILLKKFHLDPNI